MRRSNTFTIKQIADLFGNTRGAIRFYQDKGLVEPAVDDNGFRSYSLDDLFQLLYLKRFAAMSLPLEDVVAHFKRESDEGLADLGGFLAERGRALRREIEERERQLEAIEEYRWRLEGMERVGACSEPRVIWAPAYWGLWRGDIPSMMREDPDTLRKLVALIPATMIGGVYDLSDAGAFLDLELRIGVAEAREAGLERSGYFHELPAALIACSTVRLEPIDLDAQMLGALRKLSDRMASQGYVPGATAFSELVLVHKEQGRRVEYHTLYLPLQTP